MSHTDFTEGTDGKTLNITHSPLSPATVYFGLSPDCFPRGVRASGICGLL